MQRHDARVHRFAAIRRPAGGEAFGPNANNDSPRTVAMLFVRDADDDEAAEFSANELVAKHDT